jgi:hypothetical protein
MLKPKKFAMDESWTDLKEECKNIVEIPTLTGKRHQNEKQENDIRDLNTYKKSKQKKKKETLRYKQHVNLHDDQNQ